MIRDPSDGTVKEKPVLETETSGLPMSRGKSDYLARLEKSRDWLKQYRVTASTRITGEQHGATEITSST